MFFVKILQTSSEQEESGSFKLLMTVGFCSVSSLLPIGTIAIFSKMSMQSDIIVEKLLPL